MLIKLLALKAFAYRGRSLSVGDVFLAQPIDALAFTYGRQATYAPRHAVLTSDTPEPKRRYRRRDMQPVE